MHASKIATVALLLTLGVGSSCALGVQRTADAIRRQQNGSEPGATGADSRKRKGKSPWRPVVHTAAYDAADGLVDGALDAAKEPGRQEQLRELGDKLETRVESVGKSAGASIVEGINEKLPETRPVLVEIVQQLRAELGLDPEQTGRKVMRGAFAEARTGVAKLRPEVHRLLEDDVIGVIREAFDEAFGPGLKDRVRDDIKPAIDELGIPAMAQDVGKQTALGFSAGMAEALAKDGELGIVLDERMADAKATAGQAKEAVDEWLARGLLLALVIAVIVIVIVVFWWLKERNEKLVAERARTTATEEGERRERMLRLVTGAIKHAGERDSLSAFREEIKRMAEQAGERETAAALSYFLTREGLKLDKPRA